MVRAHRACSITDTGSSHIWADLDTRRSLDGDPMRHVLNPFQSVPGFSEIQDGLAHADPISAQMGAARAAAHHGPSAPAPRRGTALCLSGGGFRAVLFHLGAIRRLDELGILGHVRTISAVSGGAVIANLLAHPELGWPDPTGGPARVQGLEELVARTVATLTARNLRTLALLSHFRPGARRRSDGYLRAHVLADELERAVPWWATDLREHRRSGPAILTSATEIGYGVSWLFADASSIKPRGRIGDHRLGYAAPPPGLRLVDAVAASCAYPPFFPPMELDGAHLGLVGGSPDIDESVQTQESIRRRIQLADGGIYDNLALEPVWADHADVLVSDGGAVFRGRATGSVLPRLWHLLAIASGGGQTTRLRWLRASFAAGILRGATWSIDSPRSSERAGEASHAYPALQSVRTDLDAFSTGEQHVLERHGYLVTDAAIVRHSPHLVSTAAPLMAPHPHVGSAERTVEALSQSSRRFAWGRR